jgi:hypothetical protein
MVSITINFCKIMWRTAAKHFKAHLIFNAYGSVEVLHSQKVPEQR